jgi:lysophospholipase L1-like esterase
VRIFPEISMSGSLRFRFVLLCVLAVLGFASAAISLYVARTTYIQRASLRLHPTHETYFAAQNSRDAAANVRVVLFGDSRIAHWPVNTYLHGQGIVIRGIAGETTAQMRHRFRPDVIALRPAVVVIEAGINDLVAGALVGRGEQVRQRTYENLRDFANEARAAGCVVVLMTVVRPARPPLWRRLFWRDATVDLVGKLNRQLHSLAAVDVHIMDADAALSGSSRYMPDMYAIDTLHWNVAAYAILSSALAPLLEQNSHAVQQ